MAARRAGDTAGELTLMLFCASDHGGPTSSTELCAATSTTECQWQQAPEITPACCKSVATFCKQAAAVMNRPCLWSSLACHCQTNWSMSCSVCAAGGACAAANNVWFARQACWRAVGSQARQHHRDVHWSCSLVLRGGSHGHATYTMLAGKLPACACAAMLLLKRQQQQQQPAVKQGHFDGDGGTACMHHVAMHTCARILHLAVG